MRGRCLVPRHARVLVPLSVRGESATGTAHASGSWSAHACAIGTAHRGLPLKRPVQSIVTLTRAVMHTPSAWLLALS